MRVRCLVAGDHIRASAERKVKLESKDGSTTAVERVRTKLTLKIDDMTFDPEVGEIRASGVNTVEHEYVKLGAHHTHQLVCHYPVNILKPGGWDAMHLQQVKDMKNPSASADVAAVLMEPGSAQIILIGGSMTMVKSKIEVSVPKKRAGTTRHEQGMQRFYQYVMDGIQRHIDFAKIKVVILASPGFLKDDFYQYMLAAAQSKGLAVITSSKDRFVLAHCSAANKMALGYVLSDPKVAAKLSDTKAAGEVAALNRFFEMLVTDPERAQYGWKHVRVGADRGAVDTLLLSDALLRSRDPVVRRTYVRLVDDVKSGGGSVHLFSSLHVSGEQVANLGGVTAILRFAIGDMDDAIRSVAPDPGGSVRDPGVGPGAAGASAAAGTGVSLPSKHGTRSGYDSDSSDASSDSDASYNARA